MQCQGNEVNARTGVRTLPFEAGPEAVKTFQPCDEVPRQAASLPQMLAQRLPNDAGRRACTANYFSDTLSVLELDGWPPQTSSIRRHGN